MSSGGKCAFSGSHQSFAILCENGQYPRHVGHNLRIIAVADQDSIATVVDELVNSTNGCSNRHSAKLLRFGNHQWRTFPA